MCKFLIFLQQKKNYTVSGIQSVYALSVNKYINDETEKRKANKSPKIYILPKKGHQKLILVSKLVGF